MTIHPHTEDELLAQRGGEIVRAAASASALRLALRERLERERAGRAPRAAGARSARGRGWSGRWPSSRWLVALVAPGTTPAGPTVVQAARWGCSRRRGPAPAHDPCPARRHPGPRGPCPLPVLGGRHRLAGVRHATRTASPATTRRPSSTTTTMTAIDRRLHGGGDPRRCRSPTAAASTDFTVLHRRPHDRDLARARADLHHHRPLDAHQREAAGRAGAARRADLARSTEVRLRASSRATRPPSWDPARSANDEGPAWCRALEERLDVDAS